jgi:outer membrane biosynthesis protein TonB
MMRTGVTISALGHAAILGWSVLTFAVRPNEAKPVSAMPIDIISTSELSQLTAGTRSAPKLDIPKPLVETVGAPKPVEDTTAKVAPREIKAAAEQPPAPAPKPPAPAQKKPPEPKRDLIAEALKKDEARKPEQKRAEPKAAPAPAPKAAPQPAFDPRQLQALLDKRTPQRLAAAGDTIHTGPPSLGAPSAIGAQLSQSELDALRARLAQLWSPPAGASNPDELVALIRIQLKRDGTLAAPPQVISTGNGHSNSPLYMASRDSAVRAVLRGQPFDMLKPEHYDQWKDIEITFDPRDMIRG